MEKILKIKSIKVESAMIDAAEVPQLMDNAGVEWNTIDCCNWPKEYPYVPTAKFRIAIADDALLINYRAQEESVRAHYGDDNGSVWTDSCMETFLSPCADGSYYNLECNCIGTLLLGYHGADGSEVRADAAVLGAIKRWSSLGRTPFEERPAEGTWEVALVVPFSSYWKHSVRLEAGMTVKGNFYKCGDELAKPHFLSWAPIDFERPNFHLPKFFGTLELV